MKDMIRNLVERLTGRTKQVAGDVLDDADLKSEGEAQQEKAEAREDARRLGQLADEKDQEATGHAGQETSARG